MSTKATASIRRHLAYMNPADSLVAAHCAALSLLIAARYGTIGSEAGPYLLRFVTVLLIATVIAPAVDRFDHPWLRKPPVTWVRHFYPMTLLGAFYHWSYPVSHMFIDRPVDEALLAADWAIFGMDPARELVHLAGGRALLSEWMYFSYLSFYWVTLYLPFYLYFKGMLKEYFFVIVSAGFVVFFCFFCHALIPSRGPIYFDPPVYGHIDSGPVSRAARVFMAHADIPGAAMPSGHIAGTLAVLALAWRFARRAFWFTAPVALSLCVATVYCRYHYAVDGLVSVVIVAAGLCIAARLYPRVFPRYRL